LDERCDTSDVRSFGVLDRRGSEGPGTVVLDIDDVGCGEIVGNESKFLLNAGFLEEGSGLSMDGREHLVTRVALSLRLEVGNYVYVSTSSQTLERKRKPTMDDEDASRSRTIGSNAQEMNVVLSKRHDGDIVIREI